MKAATFIAGMLICSYGVLGGVSNGVPLESCVEVKGASCGGDAWIANGDSCETGVCLANDYEEDLADPGDLVAVQLPCGTNCTVKCGHKSTCVASGT